MNNKDFDMGIVNDFFKYDYHDRGMIKWQGFYLSDHTAALNKKNADLNQEYRYKPQQTLEKITSILAEAYSQRRQVVIQLNELDRNNVNLPDVTTLIHGYNANEIVIDSNKFVRISDIRNIGYV
ncbi:hypothetical protein [Liquorilactobacillus uvarum]|uniref:DNA-directed RNA polymerase beta subunit n=1 Tax=Liquorilactobacillus uvarum DSM 19971 TaxID=1423812 RepID=A0A0R1Q2T0_9LACO|nr:hypothetical protein [Liquorilactobacillus uvarum]KRL38967.1 hypothetical protein FD20_GL000002 [Liquorilactobacillus uvarum DSM 19971]